VLSTGDPSGVRTERDGSRAIDRRHLWGPDGEGWLSYYRHATPLGSGITERPKEESDRAWSFADPRHVAADTLARVLSVDDESIAGCLR